MSNYKVQCLLAKTYAVDALDDIQAVAKAIKDKLGQDRELAIGFRVLEEGSPPLQDEDGYTYWTIVGDVFESLAILEVEGGSNE